MDYAYIARGKLYLIDGEGIATEVESEFAQKQVREAERRNQYSPWGKDEGGDGAFGGMSVWGGRAAAARFEGYRFTHVVRLDADHLLYTLSSSTVTGLFEYDLRDKSERRLVHRNDFQFQGLDLDPDGTQLCVGQQLEEGAADIEMRDLNGRVTGQITGGDSVDCFPSFSKQDPEVVVFQSCGIARMDDGMFHSFGPSGINRIHLKTGALAEVAANDTYDYLTPQEGPEGHVYCIRRPAFSHLKVPWWRAAVQLLLFPFHFVHALYNFMNLFTQLFKNQPALAEGPKAAAPPPEQHLTILGRAINVGKAQARKNSDGEETLVPSDWKLIRLDSDETEVEVASAVCSFVLDDNGGVSYTDGYRIYHLADEKRTLLGRFPLVEKLCRL